MHHPEDGIYPEKRPTFLTVLCILTFVGSGWAIFSAITAYNTAESTVALFSDSARNKTTISTGTKTDTSVMFPKTDTFSNEEQLPHSLDNLPKENDSLDKVDDILKENDEDSTSASYEMGKTFGTKMKKNVMDMMNVDKMKNSAIGSFVAALFTLAGAFFMWRLRRYGFYIYIIGIAIGIVVPFYIYGNNLLAIGINGFSSFFGLVFIALYALNLKSMK